MNKSSILTFLSIVLLSPLLFASDSELNCQIFYSDYENMRWRRWYDLSEEQRATHKRTYEFMQKPEVISAFKLKGYQDVKLSPFSYENHGSLQKLTTIDPDLKYQNLSIKLKKPRVAKVLKNGLLEVSLVIPKKDQTNWTLAFHVKDIKKIPKCDSLEEELIFAKEIEELFLKAHKEFTNGQIGKSFIYLEAIAKKKKKQNVNINEALRNYSALFNKVKSRIEELEGEANFVDKLETIRTSLISGELSDYTRSQTSMIDALKNGGANCVGNTAFLASLIYDLKVKPEKGFEYGIELFSDHVQLVLIHLEKKINWDLISNNADSIFDTPILKAKSYARSALIKMKPFLFDGVKINISPISSTDFIFKTPKGSTQTRINPDKVGGRKSVTNYSKEELENRIDIFSYDSQNMKLVEFSSGPVPSRASNAGLLNKKMTSDDPNIKSLLTDLGVEFYESKESDWSSSGDGTWFKQEHIGETMYDDEAIRIYQESLNRGKHTAEAIRKYGHQHISKYFPSGHPSRNWRFDKAINPLHLRESEYLHEYIKFNNKYDLVWYLLPQKLEIVKNLKYMDRFEFFFEEIIEKAKKIKIFNQKELIPALDDDADLTKLTEVFKIYTKNNSFLNGCSNAFFITYSANKNMRCIDFFEYNVPGFTESYEKVFQSINNYTIEKIKNADQFIKKLDSLNVENLKDFNKSFRALSVGYSNDDEYGFKFTKVPLFSEISKHLLRNPKFFYTTDFDEEEISSLNSFVEAKSDKQRIKFLKSELPDVSLPKAGDSFPLCGKTMTTPGTSFCSEPKENTSKDEESIIEREVIKLKPSTLPEILCISCLAQDDFLFLILSWKKANFNYVNNNFNINRLDSFTQSFGHHIYLISSFYYDSFSLREFKREQEACENETSINSYRSCLYDKIKNRFNKDLAYPNWVQETDYLVPIYNYFIRFKDSGLYYKTKRSLPTEVNFLDNLDKYGNVFDPYFYFKNLNADDKQNIDEHFNSNRNLFVSIDENLQDLYDLASRQKFREKTASYTYVDENYSRIAVQTYGFYRKDRFYFKQSLFLRTKHTHYKTYIIPFIDYEKLFKAIEGKRASYDRELTKIQDTWL